MSLSNERREVLRKRINKQKGWAVARSGMTADELRALLDMADERDRYRALLGDVLEDNGHAGYTTPETLNRIDAALEGNDGD